MDKWQAIHNFWSGYGIPAYDENSVPDDAECPYITYNARIGSFEQPVQLTANIWYKSTSWAEASNKVDEIAASLYPYKIVRVDGGYMYVAEGSPFAQRMKDDNSLIKRVYVITQAEFFTRY